MTFFNLVTLVSPFKEQRNDWAAADAAYRGQRPQKVNKPRFLAGSFDALWELLGLMWAHNEITRPTAVEVAERLQKILHQ